MWSPNSSRLKRIPFYKVVSIIEERCQSIVPHTLNKWASKVNAVVCPRPHGSHMVTLGSEVMGAVCLEGWADPNCSLCAVFPYFHPSSGSYPASILHTLPPQMSGSWNLNHKVIDAWWLPPPQSCHTTLPNDRKSCRSLQREEVGVKGVGGPVQSAPFCCDFHSIFSTDPTEEGVFYSFLRQFH